MNVVRCGGRGWDCNQFLVKDAKSNAFDMVDAGHGLDFDRVLADVAAVMDPRRVRHVVVTHEHLDHVNGLPRWRELGARLVASHAAAAKLREGRDPTSESFGGRIPAITVDRAVGDGDTVRLGESDFAVLATPGHSPGSACYWDQGSGTLFAGDTLFADGGIGRFDFPDGDLRVEAESILRLGRLPVRVLHSGHGPSRSGDDAARSVAASVRHVQAALDESQ
ncbi:MAG: MBL fold metallo-hydrolase [Thermoplasmatota archaeon]|nr:MBL fold metallo-hydrolase [Halobacteriales archaeon]